MGLLHYTQTCNYSSICRSECCVICIRRNWDAPHKFGCLGSAYCEVQWRCQDRARRQSRPTRGQPHWTCNALAWYFLPLCRRRDKAWPIHHRGVQVHMLWWQHMTLRNGTVAYSIAASQTNDVLAAASQCARLTCVYPDCIILSRVWLQEVSMQLFQRQPKHPWRLHSLQYWKWSRSECCC